MVPTSDLRLPDWEELEGPTDVKNFKFASGKADALRYVAKIGAVAESTIPIYLPKTFNTAAGTLFLPSVNDVVDILSRGPEQVRRMVKEVHVNPGRNPADAYWATQPGYSNVANFRSYMTAGADGIVDIYPSTTPHNADVGRKSLAHESGHTVSQKLWGTDTNDKKWKPWRDAMKSDGISASTYAQLVGGRGLRRALGAVHGGAARAARGGAADPLPGPLGDPGDAVVKHPGTIEFVDGASGEVTRTERAEDVPEVDRVRRTGVPGDADRRASSAGDRREIRSYGADGEFLTATYQIAK